MSLVDVHASGTSGDSAAPSSSSRSRRCSACSDRAPSTACCSAPRSRSCCCSGRPPRPRVTELGRDPGHDLFRRSVAPSGERAHRPGCSSSAASQRCSTSTSSTCASASSRSWPARADAVRLVVFFLGAVPKIDLAGAELLADLHRTFRARGIAFRLADAHGEVRDALRRIGFEQEYGAARIRADGRCGRVAVEGVAGSQRRVTQGR